MIEFTRKNISEIPDISESTIQQKIADNPSILGLGDLVCIDKERVQDVGGRLDILLKNPETGKRYEVEIQLGQIDPSHIIRTIEYWDNERKRYPDCEHCAVIVAEDITNRFFNVISLFNGFIPIIAIQMNAYCVGDDYGLIFTRILDQSRIRSSYEEDESSGQANRSDYEKPYSKTIKCADDMLSIINEGLENGYELKYNKHYIGLCKNQKSSNFVWFKFTQKYMWAYFKIEEEDVPIESKELFNDTSYSDRVYRIQIYPEDFKNEDKKKILSKLAKTAEKAYYE